MASKAPSGQSYEYVLYGSVSPANHSALLHRLRGLCTGATTGGASFTDREITYKIGQNFYNFFPSSERQEHRFFFFYRSRHYQLQS